MGIRLTALVAAWAAGLAIAPLAPSSQASTPSPSAVAAPARQGRTALGHRCVPADGVRFCTGSTKVPSWDGTPLDVDVTLPPTGHGPWPTIVLLHGLGGDKSALQPRTPQQQTLAPRILPDVRKYNNLYYAKRGYAVMAASARGFGQSCGGGGVPQAWTQTGACARGFIRLADSRYEARDTQYLLGLLVDEGVTQPTKIGVTGFSYGGGQAVQLAELRNRIRLRDGSFAPWRSPAGTPMAIGAAYGQWLWSDLLSAVLPNGRFLDFRPRTGSRSLQPLGVMSQSYTRALYILAATTGYVVPPQSPAAGTDDALALLGGQLPATAPVTGSADWDLTTAVATMEQGEPYGAAMRHIAHTFRQFHGSVAIPGRPAPLLLESGWNDDFFPPTESLREYTGVRAQYPKAFVAMLLGDMGHARDANRPRVGLAFNRAASAFFDEHLRGVGQGPRNHSVLAFRTTCPALGAGAAGDGRPYRAGSWDRLHPHAVRLRSQHPGTISSSGGDPTIGLNFDPIPSTNPLGTVDPCKTIAENKPAGTANYELRIRRPFVLLGRPTVRASIVTSGSGGQIAARLWDILPGGQQRLITRGVYRLLDDQSGRIVFQLNGNGYRFATGHVVRLELAPSDAPTFRASSTPFTVSVPRLTLDLPVAARR